MDKGDDAGSEISKFSCKSLLSLTFLYKHRMEEVFEANSS